MDLILTVVKCPSHANMLNHTKVFGVVGGNIGRSDSNDWVLPDTDRILSSKHAEISFITGRFFVVDQSTNGTFINDSEVPLGGGNNYPLSEGDIINCGEYQLKVSLKVPPAKPAVPEGLGAVDFLDTSDRTTFNPATAAKQEVANSAKELDSWLDPVAPSAAKPAEDWGAVPAGNAASKNIPRNTSNDPWGVAGSADSHGLGRAETVDPLAAFDAPSPFGQPETPAWDSNDDWWKSGSEPDHAPVEQQQVRIPTPSAPAFVPPVPSSAPQPSAPFTPPPAQSKPEDNPFAESVVSGGHDDIDSLLGISTPPAAPASGFATASPSAASVTPAFVDTPVPEVPAVAPTSSTEASAPAQFDSNELQQLATLLGIDNIEQAQLQTLVPEMSSIINETVTRLIDLLRARTAIKNELRVQHTMIQMTDNNPLKFSATASDALRVMFSKDRSAFMRPAEAIQDSFDDVSDHQVAVLSGMNAAYETMLNHFNPENLKRHINAGDSLLGNKNAKNWSAFEEYYKSLKGDYETTYNELFGEDFARHYEKQLAELKNTRALKRRS